MNDRYDGVCSDFWEVPTFVDVLVDLADDRDVVAPEDVKTEHNLKNKWKKNQIYHFFKDKSYVLWQFVLYLVIS